MLKSVSIAAVSSNLTNQSSVQQTQINANKKQHKVKIQCDTLKTPMCTFSWLFVTVVFEIMLIVYGKHL